MAIAFWQTGVGDNVAGVRIFRPEGTTLMADKGNAKQGYRVPPNRAFDPMRMNWLWRLICDVGYISTNDVWDALKKTGVEVHRERVNGWMGAEEEEHYFPLTLAEIEQNLRALQQARAHELNRLAASGRQASDSPEDNK